MGLANELAEQLALDACNAAEEIGDENLPELIAKSVGTSSPTTEELYRTAVRVIQAERRARALLEERVKAANAAGANPAPAAATGDPATN